MDTVYAMLDAVEGDHSDNRLNVLMVALASVLELSGKPSMREIVEEVARIKERLDGLDSDAKW